MAVLTTMLDATWHWWSKSRWKIDENHPSKFIFSRSQPGHPLTWCVLKLPSSWKPQKTGRLNCRDCIWGTYSQRLYSHVSPWPSVYLWSSSFRFDPDNRIWNDSNGRRCAKIMGPFTQVVPLTSLIPISVSVFFNAVSKPTSFHHKMLHLRACYPSSWTLWRWTGLSLSIDLIWRCSLHIGDKSQAR
jgi:hypothetical protein